MEFPGVLFGSGLSGLRIMAKKIITLFIRDNAVNLLVVEGKQITKWASLELEPGLVRQGLVVDEARTAAKVKELFDREKVKTKKVIFGLSGVNSVYRIITLPQLPPAMIPEAVKREAKRVLPVLLEEFYLSYQILAAPRGETHIFLAAFPRNVTDALVRTVRRAGIEPYIMDLSPLALCRIPNEPRAIVVNARLDHLDVMVIADRLPQVIRRLSVPTEAESLSERLPTIAEELNRTVAFYNSSHQEKPLDSTVPVFICGELAEAPETWESLVGGLGYSVSPLTSPLESPDGFSPNEFMVNIGLALKQLLPEKKEANSSLVNFNALPEAYRPKGIALLNILLPVGVVVGIGLLIIMVVLIQVSAADTAVLRAELAPIESRVVQTRAEIAALMAQIEATEAQIKPAEDAAAVLSATFTDLGRGRERVNVDLAWIVILAGSRVNLADIAHDGNTVTITGTAPDATNIFTYARLLRRRFGLVFLPSITRMGEEGFSFDMRLEHRE